METKFDYTLVGDVYIPNLISTETSYEIGFWGNRHKEYIKENHKVIYYNLLTKVNLIHICTILILEQKNNMIYLLNNLQKVKVLQNNSKLKIKCYGCGK